MPKFWKHFTSKKRKASEETVGTPCHSVRGGDIEVQNNPTQNNVASTSRQVSKSSSLSNEKCRIILR